MNKQRLIIIASLILATLSLILPWWRSHVMYEDHNINGFSNSDGILYVVLFLIALAYSLSGEKRNSIGSGSIKGVVIPVGISFTLALTKLINISNNRFVTKMGPGLYLLLFSLTVVLLSCFVFRNKDSEINKY
jgi:hypothetical protein